MHRILQIAATAVATAWLTACSTPVPSTSWQTLIDGESGLENFTQLGAANWTATDGAISADHKSSAEAGILLSKNSYRDFELHVEFSAADPGTNSGIYLRVMNQKTVNTKAAYEVQIWDASPNMPTASVIPVVKAPSTFKAGGKWNSFDITAKGPLLSVKMNGEQVVTASDGAFTSGPIGLQYNAGTIKFRKVMIRPI